MPEICPLGDSQVWDEEIPEQCRGCLRDIADALPTTKIDTFNEDCSHGVEFGGESLQRTEGAGRLRGVVQVCMSSDERTFHDEVAAEETEFVCPDDESVAVQPAASI